MEKPSFDEVMDYVKSQFQYNLKKLSLRLPAEQIEEMEQNAYLRAWKLYERLDPEKGWKKLIQLNTRGAILDYIRNKNGFMESFIPKDGRGKNKPWKLTERVDIHTLENDITLEEVLAERGHSMASLLKREPRWDLLARMARLDDDIHIVSKYLLGYEIKEIAKIWNINRHNIGNRIKKFYERLLSVENLGSKWVAQTLYAFNICHIFNQKDQDMYVGYEFEPVDLYSDSVFVVRQKNKKKKVVLNYRQENQLDLL